MNKFSIKKEATQWPELCHIAFSHGHSDVSTMDAKSSSRCKPKPQRNTMEIYRNIYARLRELLGRSLLGRSLGGSRAKLFTLAISKKRWNMIANILLLYLFEIFIDRSSFSRVRVLFSYSKSLSACSLL